MFGVMPLQPAYGRDYKSRAAVLADWNAGKDFMCANGRYTSKRDFEDGVRVEMRYAGARKSMTFKNGEE